MSEKCPNCGSGDVYVKVLYPYHSVNLACCRACGHLGEEPEFTITTVFEQITASLEILAEKLVYPTYGMISRTWDFEKDDWGTAEPSWSSTVLPPDRYFSTKEQAVTATIEKLKEAKND